MTMHVPTDWVVLSDKEALRILRAGAELHGAPPPEKVPKDVVKAAVAATCEFVFAMQAAGYKLIPPGAS